MRNELGQEVVHVFLCYPHVEIGLEKNVLSSARTLIEFGSLHLPLGKSKRVCETGVQVGVLKIQIVKKKASNTSN